MATRLVDADIPRDIEECVQKFAYLVRKYGYSESSLRTRNGELHDLDLIEADGTRHYATMIDGDWCGLVSCDE